MNFVYVDWCVCVCVLCICVILVDRICLGSVCVVASVTQISNCVYSMFMCFLGFITVVWIQHIWVFFFFSKNANSYFVESCKWSSSKYFLQKIAFHMRNWSDFSTILSKMKQKILFIVRKHSIQNMFVLTDDYYRFDFQTIAILSMRFS